MAKKPLNQPKPLFEIPPPNEDLFDWGGDLAKLRRAEDTPRGIEARGCVYELPAGPLGRPFTWCDPRWLEHMLDNDPALKGVLLFALRKGGDLWKKKAQAAVAAVCEQYLAEVREQFRQYHDLLTTYVLAKAAYHKLHPPEAEEPAPSRPPPPDEPEAPAERTVEEPPAKPPNKRHRARKPARAEE